MVIYGKTTFKGTTPNRLNTCENIRKTTYKYILPEVRRGKEKDNLKEAQKED